MSHKPLFWVTWGRSVFLLGWSMDLYTSNCWQLFAPIGPCALFKFGPLDHFGHGLHFIASAFFPCSARRMKKGLQNSSGQNTQAKHKRIKRQRDIPIRASSLGSWILSNAWALWVSWGWCFRWWVRHGGSVASSKMSSGLRAWSAWQRLTGLRWLLPWKLT